MNRLNRKTAIFCIASLAIAFAHAASADNSVASYLPSIASQGDGIGGYQGSQIVEAQTFTATGSGFLSRIGVSLQYGAQQDGVTIQLRDAAGGTPGSIVLASSFLPPASIVQADFGNTVLTYFDFSTSGIALVSGIQYTIVIESGTASSDINYYVNAKGQYEYSGGGAFQSYDGGMTFGAYGGAPGLLSDVFDVRVVPEPSSVALLAAGIAICGGLRQIRRAKRA